MRFFGSLLLSFVLVASLVVWGIGYGVLFKILQPSFVNYIVDQAPFEDAGDYFFDFYGTTLTRQGFPRESIGNFKKLVMSDGVLIADVRGQIKANGSAFLEWLFSGARPETLNLVFTTRAITATIVDGILVPAAQEAGLPVTRDILQSLVERKIPPSVSFINTTDAQTMKQLADVKKGLVVFRVLVFAAGALAFACVLFLFLLERRFLARWATFVGLSFGTASLALVGLVLVAGQRAFYSLQNADVAPLGYDLREFLAFVVGVVQQQFWPVIGLFFLMCLIFMIGAVIARKTGIRYTSTKEA